MMKRLDPRVVLGALLLLGGGLLLAQTMGYLKNASDVFWGSIFLLAGPVFLSLLFGGNWWAVFPGFTLTALGVIILFNEQLGDFSGMVILGGVALSFWAVYLMDRSRWWALIPAGVMGTLAVVAAVDSTGLSGDMSGSIFFLGLGLTFAVLGLLPDADGKVQRWAFIPAAVLLLMAMVIGTIYASTLNYVWPIVLIVAGGVLVYKAVQSRQLR